MTTETLILAGGLLLLAAVLSSLLADRAGVPTLLLFLVVGMLAGSEGVGGIAFDSPDQAQMIGSICLMVILFTGGLDTRWQDIRPQMAPGLSLSTLGVLLTALFLAVFAKIVLGTWTSFDIGADTGLSWIEALLIAAIISSTDAAAVFSVYRTSTVQPRKNLRSLLELESGSNDPMAVLLTVTILGVMVGEQEIGGALLIQVIVGLLLGAAAGFVLGLAGSALVNAVRLSVIGLFPMLALATCALAFGAADTLGGNPFLSVYVAGVVLSHRIHQARETVLAFHDGLSWLMQIIIFVMLGLLVFPSQLLPVAGVAIAIALFLMFVARPLAVALSYGPFRPQKNELAYISWVGLRGSVPIVLATFPASYGIEHSGQIFHLVFFVVIVSVLVQGVTLVSSAKLLGVTEKATAHSQRAGASK